MKHVLQANFKKCSMAAVAFCLSVLQILSTVSVQALGKSDVSSSVIKQLINETTTQIAPGIQEKRLTYTNTDNFRTECFRRL